VEDAMQYASIAVGAMIGANLRYVVANWAADRWGGDFPYGRFIINVTGAFVIGVFLALVTDRLTVNPLWRLFFATGFLGCCCSPRRAPGCARGLTYSAAMRSG
jgi:CrcB protein